MCKFAITRKSEAFVAKIVITRLTKFFMVIFAHAERLPTVATLPWVKFYQIQEYYFLHTTSPHIHWLSYTSRFLVQRIAKRFARRSKAVWPWPGLMVMPPCILWPVPCSIRYHWHLKVNLPTHWGRLRPSQRPVKNVSLDLLIAAAAFKVIAKEICMITNHCGRWMRRHGGQPCWHCWQCWIMGAV